MGVLRHGSLLLLLAAGCSFEPSIEGAGGDDPARVDPHCEWQVASGIFSPCALPEPIADLEITGSMTLDTDSGMLSSGTANRDLGGVNFELDGIAVHAIALESLSVVGKLRVVGSRPLLIAAWDRVSVSGEVDLDSRVWLDGVNLVRDLGAGSGAGCQAHAGSAGDADDKGAGGGAGGSLGTLGAMGGIGADDGGATQGGVPQFVPASALPALTGGCAGGVGGLGEAADDFGHGGAGGGGIHIAARGGLEVTGAIYASGAGGASGTAFGGGGGGGSGGYVGLEAGELSLEGATIAVNGGGGGAGAAHDQPGGLGGNSTRLAMAPGGNPIHEHAGSGGSGASFAVAEAAPGQGPDDSGGGGGGGLGLVRVYTSAGLSVLHGVRVADASSDGDDDEEDDD